jgi:putative FmdB family regulatory protein
MPIYEYLCQRCDQEFEVLLRGSEKASCPSCGGKQLTKKFSVPAAHTEGSSQPPCPAKEAGSCDVSDCCANNCGMANWM